jgi:hypothetical protein
MRLRHLLPIACLLATTACATSGSRGWSGQGATPFDTAQATCDAKTRDLPAGEQREDAFDACMQENGWKRP